MTTSRYNRRGGRHREQCERNPIVSLQRPSGVEELRAQVQRLVETGARRRLISVARAHLRRALQRQGRPSP